MERERGTSNVWAYFLFTLVLFQESQDRKGAVSQTNAENQGIKFINLSFSLQQLINK